MSKVYVISDLHFGHHNMALNRGFKDTFEHDEYIISQWNKVVSKNDVVWILGDITMEKSIHYYRLDQLKGIKKVVLGNHDEPQHIPELLTYVNKVCGVMTTKDFIFTHIPIHESELYHKINVHGHNHRERIPDKRYFNVSCELWDYTPILISDIKTLISSF